MRAASAPSVESVRVGIEHRPTKRRRQQGNDERTDGRIRDIKKELRSGKNHLRRQKASLEISPVEEIQGKFCRSGGNWTVACVARGDGGRGGARIWAHQGSSPPFSKRRL